MRNHYRPRRKDRPQPKSTKLKSFLDQLQDKSWNLELLVSGIIVLLLLQAYNPLRDWLFEIETLRYADNLTVIALRLLANGLFYAYVVLVIIFIAHLALRGFWIGAIGLRSVSGGYELGALRYKKRYASYLARRLRPFDRYVDTLEKLSSLTFALAFLIFLSIISLVLFCTVFVAGFLTFAYVIFLFAGSVSALVKPLGWLGIVLIALYFVGGALYFIDFLSFGALKRSRLLGKLYWPIYRFFGWVTLANFYRPIYYNVADDPFSRRIIKRYLLALAVIAVLTRPFALTPYHWFPGYQGFGGSDVAVPELVKHKDITGVYLDEAANPREVELGAPSLASRFAREDYLELFIPYRRHYTDHLRQKQRYDKREYWYNGNIILRPEKDEFDLGEKAIITYRKDTKVFLDGRELPSNDLYFYHHPFRHQPGLVLQIPTFALARGRHLIRVEQQALHREMGNDFKSGKVVTDTLGVLSFYR
ncbi:hypothetical protein [Lewinella sp. 4G2]|uniref:hypothetical protein n=1 Tax=Lewinella sp. 4G2 TaxID=1803372 RepID=UPI0012F8B437|nr:hypothetical protein [Lewinella sp. 4G2]